MATNAELFAQAVFDCIAQSEVVLEGYTTAAGDVDANTGQALDAGLPALINPDTGDIFCIAKPEPVTQAEAGTDALGTDFEAGAKGVIIPGYGFVCLGDKDFDRIKSAGEVVPAGTVITDGSVDAALLDANGALLADYTVQAGEVFMFDGDEACGKEQAENFAADADYIATLPTDAEGNAVDSSGTVVNEGDEVLVVGGQVICIPSKDAAPAVQENFTGGDTLPENMTGTVDIQLADGSIVTLGAGDVIPETAIVDVFVDEVTGAAACRAQNPVVSQRCIDGGIEHKYKDGSDFCHNATLRTVRGSIGAGAFARTDGATPLGTIAGSEDCETVTIPKCGARIMAYYYSSYTPQAGTGVAGYRPEISFDGGATWLVMPTGGRDDVYMQSQRYGEVSFVDWLESPILAGGTYTVCTRINLALNTLNGEVVINTTMHKFDTIEERCC